MTPLRESFLSLLRLRHVSPRTIERYEKIVEELAFFHDRSPLGMTADDIQTFLLYCVNIRKFAPSTTNQYIAGLRTFYHMLEPGNTIMDRFTKMRIEHKIPHVLDQSELKAIFKHISNIKHRTALKLIYSAGLRISECCSLKVCDVESARMMLRIEDGKGKKDRYTVLSPKMLTELRQYYRACRPNYYLFEGRQHKPISDTTLTVVLKNAARTARINKPVYPHLLRHCFATHLLEQGTPLVSIQRLLGHKHIRTTCGYTQVSDDMLRSIRSPADSLEDAHE
jgi:integrase/recombinase XerD